MHNVVENRNFFNFLISTASKPSIVSGELKNGKKASVQFSNDIYAKARGVSAPLNYADFLRLPLYSDFEATYSEMAGVDARPLLAFNNAREGDLSDEDLRSMEGRQRISFQRMKEVLLGSVSWFGSHEKLQMRLQKLFLALNSKMRYLYLLVIFFSLINKEPTRIQNEFTF